MHIHLQASWLGVLARVRRLELDGEFRHVCWLFGFLGYQVGGCEMGWFTKRTYARLERERQMRDDGGVKYRLVRERGGGAVYIRAIAANVRHRLTGISAESDMLPCVISMSPLSSLAIGHRRGASVWPRRHGRRDSSKLGGAKGDVCGVGQLLSCCSEKRTSQHFRPVARGSRTPRTLPWSCQQWFIWRLRNPNACSPFRSCPGCSDNDSDDSNQKPA